MYAQVVAAISKQLATLNTNARYLHEGLCTYAEELTATFPEPLSVSCLPVTQIAVKDGMMSRNLNTTALPPA